MELIIAFLSLFLIGHTTHTSNSEIQENTIEHSTLSQEATYHSSSTNKDLPYYFIEPSNKPGSILIYMHGAGGGYEQGMSDELFKGNFKNLKTILKENNTLYITPETTDFEQTGSKQLVDLIFELKKEYGELPIYLSGASAGGRTAFYALQELEKRNIGMGKDFFLKGIIFICPAISEESIKNLNSHSKETKIWIEVGEKDSVITPETAQILLNKFEEFGNKVNLVVVKNGDHNAPVEQIEWEKVMETMK